MPVKSIIKTLSNSLLTNNHTYAIIRCKKSHQIFYTNQSMQKRRKAWPLTVGIDVTFIPKPASAQGNHPNATQVKQ